MDGSRLNECAFVLVGTARKSRYLRRAFPVRKFSGGQQSASEGLSRQTGEHGDLLRFSYMVMSQLRFHNIPVTDEACCVYPIRN